MSAASGADPRHAGNRCSSPRRERGRWLPHPAPAGPHRPWLRGLGEVRHGVLVTNPRWEPGSNRGSSVKGRDRLEAAASHRPWLRGPVAQHPRAHVAPTLGPWAARMKAKWICRNSNTCLNLPRTSVAEFARSVRVAQVKPKVVRQQYLEGESGRERLPLPYVTERGNMSRWVRFGGAGTSL
jgi:hypothetical protein